MNEITEPTTAELATDRPLVDVRDMVVVHTALLRELRLLPSAVSRVAHGDRAQAAVVDGHLQLVSELLHHHHQGEDELLWPVLRPRLSASAVALVDEAGAQHAEIAAGLAEVAARRGPWAEHARAEDGEALAESLRRLHRLLDRHLTTEEQTLLPLAATHLEPAEWGAVGAAGAASVPKRQMLLVFGMFAYEGDERVLADMLHAAPPPVRFVVPRLAPRAYARRAAAVHGTSRP